MFSSGSTIKSLARNDLRRGEASLQFTTYRNLDAMGMLEALATGADSQGCFARAS
jgi:hypothetical protein